MTKWTSHLYRKRQQLDRFDDQAYLENPADEDKDTLFTDNDVRFFQNYMNPIYDYEPKDYNPSLYDRIDRSKDNVL